MLHEVQKAIRFSSSFLQKQLVHLHMQVLYNCNFRCKICHFWENTDDRPKRMTLENARIIATKLDQLGPLMICLTGGEPLVHKNLPDIVQLLSKNNYLSLVTNGWLMTPEKARALFASGIQHVAVSLDYADPKKHDGLRGKAGAYHRAVNALRTLQENRTSAYQRVHMITVVMDDNLEEIEPLIVLANKLGITYLVNMYSSCRGKKENKTVGDVSEHLMGLRRKYRNFISTSGYLAQFSQAARSQEGIKPCYAGKNLFNIDSQGNVGLCLDRLKEPVGNILSEDVTSLKNKLLNEFTHNECGDCWTSCRGGIEPLMYGEQQLLNLRQSYRIFQKSPLSPKAPEPQDVKIPANVVLSGNQ